jgi:hypothetical protein
LEKNRIYYAAIGWLILSFFPPARAQESRPDTLNRPDIGLPDSIRQPEMPEMPDSLKTREDSKSEKMPVSRRGRDLDKLEALPDSILAEPAGKPEAGSLYDQRTYLSRGVGDETKYQSNLFIITPGMAGSPQIPVEYLNVAGPEITINGLPFAYNGLYRPYMIGTDLNVVPWEIVNGIRTGNGIIDFSIGAPPNDVNRSDVELARGPYGYDSPRWRFFRPFNRNTYAYFTLGFKKSSGYFFNTDYNGYHVTGGLKKHILGGKAEIDLWKHRARAGLLSFDDLAGRLSRQSRGIDRAEFRFGRTVISPLEISVTGLFQRSAQTITGYSGEMKTKHDIGGGKGSLCYEYLDGSLGVGAAYYNVRLYGLPDRRPSVNIFEYLAEIDGRRNELAYNAKVKYEWNGADHGAFLPELTVSYRTDWRIAPFISFTGNRRNPDLNLLYFNDQVAGLGIGQTLESYRFLSNIGLVMPITKSASAGVEFEFETFDALMMISRKRVDDQIRLVYDVDSLGEVTVSPVNFDDEFMEVSGKIEAASGPFSGELGGTFRKWKDDYFSDGTEKGPAAVGFGRISFLRQFFIPDLYLGGSLEMQASSRRDYRSVLIGYTDGFAVFSGRLEFRYKDFTFWLNENNLENLGYYSLWPYPEEPRTVWWGFRWRFLD